MKILYATDGSPEADAAKELLASLPLPSGSELIIMSVVSQGEGDPRGGGEAGAHGLAAAQTLTEQAAYYLAKAGVSTECVVGWGHPADRIIRAAEEREAQLVVVGSRGRSSLLRFFLGSVSHRVAKHAPIPVMIVKPPAHPIVKVLVGVDGSEDSRKAVKFLNRFPLPPDVSVCMAHVVHVPSPAFAEYKGYYETAELGGELERLKTAAEVDGKMILEEAAKLLEGIEVETVVTAGPPAQRLVELAGERAVSLLVVGSRGLTGVERFLMGSVSLQVCHHAPSSVLVVRS